MGTWTLLLYGGALYTFSAAKAAEASGTVSAAVLKFAAVLAIASGVVPLHSSTCILLVQRPSFGRLPPHAARYACGLSYWAHYYIPVGTNKLVDACMRSALQHQQQGTGLECPMASPP